MLQKERGRDSRNLNFFQNRGYDLTKIVVGHQFSEIDISPVAKYTIEKALRR
jgi:hypothetical protein